MFANNKFTRTAKALWTDESAQGATEYILLVAVVVALVILFKGKITNMLTDKLGQISDAMGQIKPGGQ